MRSHFSRPTARTPDVPCVVVAPINLTRFIVGVTVQVAVNVAEAAMVSTPDATIDAIAEISESPKRTRVAAALDDEPTAGSAPPSRTRFESAVVMEDADGAADPATVNLPLAVTLDVTLEAAESSLTRLIAVLDATAVEDTSALLPRILEPLPILLDAVLDVPLINAEPSGTLRADAVVDEDADVLAEFGVIFSGDTVAEHETDAEANPLTIVAASVEPKGVSANATMPYII